MSRKSPRKAAAPDTAVIELNVEAGHGFESKIVDGAALQITQHNAEAPDDNIVLSRTEAKIIFAKYADWAGLAFTEVAS